MTSVMPLYGSDNSDSLQRPIAYWKGRLVSRNEFAQHVSALSSQLPKSRYVVNLCNDRYLFLVAFTAAINVGQTNLLPANRASRTILDVVHQHEDSYCICDEELEDIELSEKQYFRFNRPEISTENIPFDISLIPEQHIAAIAFTSGSTGNPSPNTKTWGSLAYGAKKAQKRFSIGEKTTTYIIATVPPQHMYGLETTIILPLFSDCCIHTGKAFYPEDIRLALNDIPSPKVIITTPVHLRACANADIAWPKIELIISATAPLDTTLAEKSESVFTAPVYEIYGFTEAGSIASRRTAEGKEWTPYDDFVVSQQSGSAYVSIESMEQPVPLTDLIELQTNGNFILLGRESDLINIAGKRASLTDLNQKLLSINEIQDGVFFVPDENINSTTRLIAFVVATNISESEIREKLSAMIDPAFLPRPLLLIDNLPRTKSSKLPRKRLIELYNATRKEATIT